MDRIATAIARAQIVWAACMLVVTGVTVATVSEMWYTIFLIPLAFCSYFIVITVTAICASIQDTNVNTQKLQELNERLGNGTLEPGPEMYRLLQEAGLSEVTVVEGLSPEIIGSYDGHTMYEWIEVRDPHTQDLQRYTYHGPALDAMCYIPSDPDKLFATVDGIVYERDR